jgi:hypothetical protein
LKIAVRIVSAVRGHQNLSPGNSFDPYRNNEANTIEDAFRIVDALIAAEEKRVRVLSKQEVLA